MPPPCFVSVSSLERSSFLVCEILLQTPKAIKTFGVHIYYLYSVLYYLYSVLYYLYSVLYYLYSVLYYLYSVLCYLYSVLYYLLSVLYYLYSVLLNHALCHHSLGYLHEASHVSALHIVYIAVGLGTILHAVLVDVLHDPVQLVVNFLT